MKGPPGQFIDHAGAFCRLQIPEFQNNSLSKFLDLLTFMVETIHGRIFLTVWQEQSSLNFGQPA